MFWLIFGAGLLVLFGCAFSNASHERKTQELKSRPLAEFFNVKIRNVNDLPLSAWGGEIPIMICRASLTNPNGVHLIGL